MKPRIPTIVVHMNHIRVRNMWLDFARLARWLVITIITMAMWLKQTVTIKIQKLVIFTISVPANCNHRDRLFDNENAEITNAQTGSLPERRNVNFCIAETTITESPYTFPKMDMPSFFGASFCWARRRKYPAGATQ